MVFLIVVVGVVLLVIGCAAFSNFELDDYHYDRLKWLTIRWSYITTFLALIVKTFEVHYGIETVAVVAGIGAMMAGLLGVSTMNYVAPTQTTVNDEDFVSMFDFDELDEVEDEDKNGMSEQE